MNPLHKIQTHPLLKRVLSGAFWSLLTSVINRLTPLIISFVVARTLGKESFGEYSMLRGTVSMVGVFAGFGIGTTATKEVAKWRENNDSLSEVISSVIAIAITTGIIGALVLYGYADYIAEHYLTTIDLADEVRISAGLLLFSVIGGALQGVINGLEAYRVSAIANGILLLGAVPFAWFCISWWGVEGAIIAMTSHAFFTALFLFAGVKLKISRGISCIFNVKQARLKLLMGIALPLMLIQIIPTPAFWYVRVLLIRATGGFSEVAVFDAAYQWLGIIMIVTGSVTMVSLSIFSASANKSDYRVLLKMNALGAFVMVSVFCLLSPLVSRVYGKDFGGDWWIFCVVFLCAIPFTVSSISRNFLIAENKIKNVFVIIIIQNSLLLLLCLVFTSVLTAELLAVFNLFSWFVSMCSYLYVTRRCII